MDAERMPGDSEAAAAAAGMQAIYGHGHAVGDALWFQPTAGAMPRQGRVELVNDDGCLLVRDDDGTVHAIAPTQIAEF